jgi:hypothetical protein
MKFLFLFMGLLSINSYAQSNDIIEVTCNITNLLSAEACMSSQARAMTAFEKANEPIANTNKASLIKLVKALGLDPEFDDETINTIKKASYVGAILEHGDEHVIYYYVMNKGTNIPELVWEINLVDLESEMVSILSPNDLFLGANAKKYDVYEDIVESIQNFKDQEIAEEDEEEDLE